METHYIIFGFALFTVLFCWLAAEVYYLKKQVKTNTENKNPELAKVRLIAFERLSLLSQRISLTNLIIQDAPSELNAKQYAQLLISNIREEFSYNTPQQVYVSVELWKGINNLKEKNIFVITQVAQMVPQNAAANDLVKAMATYINAQPNMDLSGVVSEALQYEAKSLM